MPASEKPLALDHLRVLELPGLAGAYFGKLFADLGADVIKVEPPEGDPMRFTGPFAGDKPDIEHSLPFINYHTNKRSAVLDLTTEEGRAAFRSLIPAVDVVIDNYQPGALDELGLGYEALKALNPGIVLTSITTFGQKGMYHQFQGSDLVGNAMSGLLLAQGDPNMPPCNTPLDQGYQMASIHGAISSLYVLLQRMRTGKGDHIDISIQDVMGHIPFAIGRYDVEMAVSQRPGERAMSPGINCYPVKDGFIHMYTRRWERLRDWLDLDELKTPEWQDAKFRRDNADAAEPLIARFTSTMTKEEFSEASQRMGIPAAPVSTTADFVNSPHTKERGFFVEVEHPLLGTIKFPGAPYTLSETPWQVRRGTPRLGEHTAEVLAEARQPRPRVEMRSRSTDRPQQRVTPPGLPFANTRVLDFTIAFAGPFGARYLAELGAEVIKVESSNAGTNTAQPGAGATANQVEINRSKRSITLDLHHARAQELAREIAKISDFAMGNFRPGTLDGWNVGYKDLKAVKPDIIMAEMPGFGSVGPHAHYTSLGPTLTAYSGMMRLWGHPESSENARAKIAYPDWIGAGKVTLALLAAMHYRDRTGLGQYIEVAQVEGAAAMAGTAYLDYFLNDRVMEPTGNRHATFAPHNVYPCEGVDRWVAISILTDQQWVNLVRALGSPSWAVDESLAAAAGRKAREAEIDLRIAEWTKQYTPHLAMRILQKAGVPAGAVQSGEDMWLDPHLRSRGYTITVDQPGLGKIQQSGPTMRFKETPEVTPRGQAIMGEANEYVFGELLGYGSAEIKQLMADGIIS